MKRARTGDSICFNDLSTLTTMPCKENRHISVPGAHPARDVLAGPLRRRRGLPVGSPCAGGTETSDEIRRGVKGLNGATARARQRAGERARQAAQGELACLRASVRVTEDAAISSATAAAAESAPGHGPRRPSGG